jgi:Meiotically up-regulated gene 113
MPKLKVHNLEHLLFWPCLHEAGNEELAEAAGDCAKLQLVMSRILSAHRVIGEWFNVTLDQAKAAIAQARAQRSA